MRLIEFRVHDFKVLRNLELRFKMPGEDPAGDERYDLTLLVGNNGSGKSTVLQALARVFHLLSQQRVQDLFGFDLTYRLNGQIVSISHQAGAEAVTVTVRKGRGRARKSELTAALLPKRVICYTTGRHSTWTHVTADPYASSERVEISEDAYIRERRYEPAQSAPESEDGRVVVIRPDRLPHMFLTGWLAARADGEPRRLSPVLSATGVRRVTGLALRLRLRGEGISSYDLNDARRLAALASERRWEGEDITLFFKTIDMSQAQARELHTVFQEKGRDKTDDRLSLYQRLDAWSNEREGKPKVLREISIFLERIDEHGPWGEAQHFEQLSDGEQSFLARMALFSLVGQPDTLVLIDEPEVHFNDYWKRTILHTLDQSVASGCHVLIATHSSITLTDVEREDVRVLRPVRGDGGARWTQVSKPDIETYAADPGDIMVRVFGAPVAIGERSRDDLANLLVRLEGMKDGALEEADEKLRRMAPGYWSFRLRQVRRSMVELES